MKAGARGGSFLSSVGLFRRDEVEDPIELLGSVAEDDDASGFASAGRLTESLQAGASAAPPAPTPAAPGQPASAASFAHYQYRGPPSSGVPRIPRHSNVIASPSPAAPKAAQAAERKRPPPLPWQSAGSDSPLSPAAPPVKRRVVYTVQSDDEEEDAGDRQPVEVEPVEVEPVEAEPSMFRTALPGELAASIQRVPVVNPGPKPLARRQPNANADPSFGSEKEYRRLKMEALLQKVGNKEREGPIQRAAYKQRAPPAKREPVKHELMEISDSDSEEDVAAEADEDKRVNLTLRKCEEISTKMRNLLGQAADEERVRTIAVPSSLKLCSIEDVQEACGTSAAAFEKRKQERETAKAQKAKDEEPEEVEVVEDEDDDEDEAVEGTKKTKKKEKQTGGEEGADVVVIDEEDDIEGSENDESGSEESEGEEEESDSEEEELKEPPTLKGYQLLGVNFMLLLSQEAVGGAILADEMGLGKTAQSISFLGLHRKQLIDAGQKAKPAIVVAPASLLDNWQRELKTWCPSMRVVVYHGERRLSEFERLARYLPGQKFEGKPLPVDVIVTCYSLFERDSEDSIRDRKLLGSWDYSHMILDEAHGIKNNLTQRAVRLRKLSRRCGFRLLLTGTPIQNDLAELESLLSFMLPSLFEEEGLLHRKKEQGGEDSPELRNKRIARAKRVLAPFILRRLKSDVLEELVPKTSSRLIIEMTTTQKTLYSKTVGEYKEEAKKKQESKAAKGGTSSSSGQDLMAVLGAKRINHLFTELRKIANHPLLTRSIYKKDQLEKIAAVAARKKIFGTDASKERVLEHLNTLGDFEIHQVCTDTMLKGQLGKYALDSAHSLNAGKTMRLQELLKEIRAKGSRPLVFSQWKILLDILEWVLDTLGYSFCRLDGDTPVNERLGLVDEWNDPESKFDVFLLSTRAGGQGLNLTGADTVILHDCDFNPQIDRQAEDRVHRLGQTKPVTVYRLVSDGTVDKRIVELADQKLGLDRAVLESVEKGAGGKGKTADKAAETQTMAALLKEAFS